MHELSSIEWKTFPNNGNSWKTTDCGMEISFSKIIVLTHGLHDMKNILQFTLIGQSL